MVTYIPASRAEVVVAAIGLSPVVARPAGYVSVGIAYRVEVLEERHTSHRTVADVEPNRVAVRGVKAVRESLVADVQQALDEGKGSDNLKAALSDWKDNFNVSENTRERADKLTELLEAEKGDDKLLNKIYNNRDFFVKRSQWILGGDGWAYDIGYGGLDHVLASGEDVNVFVFDTEVYSNTGGQASCNRSIRSNR